MTNTKETARRIVVLFAMMLFTSTCFAQTTKKVATPSRNYDKEIVELLQKIDTLTESNNKLLNFIEKYKNEERINNICKDRYKLYPTENIYNFLLLDTYTGRIRQVQWKLESGLEISTIINDNNLNSYEDDIGQYELYPTKNMFQFILLDKKIGRNWHVQWGFEKSNRWIREMY